MTQQYKYDYLSLSPNMGHHYLLVDSTNPQVLDWIVKAVKDQIPSAKVRVDEKDFYGSPTRLALHGLANKDDMVFFWLFKLVCINGFMPFSTDMWGYERSSEKIYHFRRERLIENS